MRQLLLLTLLVVLCTAAPGLPAPAHAQDVAAQDEPAAAPDAFELTPAYPNPFRYRTQFTLRVDETQQVEISVYNVLAQKVRTLYNDVMVAGRPRIFTLYAGSLPSGIYLYRVQGETFVTTRRMTLVN